MSEVTVSLIDGVNVLLVNGFIITIEPIPGSNDFCVLSYIVSCKGEYINTYLSLQQAVKWCSN